MPKKLLSHLAAASRADGDAAFMETLLGAWARVSGGDYHSITRRHMETGEVEFWHPGEGRLGPDHQVPRLFAKLWAMEDSMATHPSVAAFLRDGPGAYVRSRLEPDHEWKRRAHYRIVDKPLGIVDMVSVFLAPSNGILLAVHAGSRQGNFRDGVLGAARDFAAVADSLLRARGGFAGAEPKSTPALSNREIELLRLVEQGKRNAEIAALLGLSVHTVRKHMENIFAKLGVETRTSAAKAAREFF